MGDSYPTSRKRRPRADGSTKKNSRPANGVVVAVSAYLSKWSEPGSNRRHMDFQNSRSRLPKPLFSRSFHAVYPPIVAIASHRIYAREIARFRGIGFPKTVITVLRFGAIRGSKAEPSGGRARQETRPVAGFAVPLGLQPSRLPGVRILRAAGRSGNPRVTHRRL